MRKTKQCPAMMGFCVFLFAATAWADETSTATANAARRFLTAPRCEAESTGDLWIRQPRAVQLALDSASGKGFPSRS